MDKYTTILSAVPLLPTLLATLAIIVVGSVWYSHALFGKAWSRHTGIRASDIRPAEIKRGYLFGSLVAFATAYLLGVVAVHANGNPFALFGSAIFVWLFVMLEITQGFIWRREPFALFLLQSFRSLFSLLAAALVFFVWSNV